MLVQIHQTDLNPSPLLHHNKLPLKSAINFVAPLTLEKSFLCLSTEKARQHRTSARSRLDPQGA